MTESATGIILAGGQSRRMGTDKARLRIGDTTLLERTAATLAAVAARVIVVERLGISLPGTEVITDDVPNQGPLGGLATGLRRTETDWAIVVATDLPLLSAAALRYLLAAASGWDAVVPQAANRPHPLHAVYARGVLPVAETQLATGELSMQSFLDQLRVRWIDEAELSRIPGGLASLTNVNTAEDWDRVVHRQLTSGRDDA